MSENRFDLKRYTDQLYDRAKRKLACPTQSPDTWAEWQKQIKTKAAELLGIAERKAPLSVPAETVHEKDRGLFVQRKLALDVGEGVEAPIYLLVPKEAKLPYRPVMVFHGHNDSIQPVLGNYESEQFAEENRARDGNYAQALVEAGFLVCGVEQRGFGQRQSDKEGTAWSCRHQSLAYIMQGLTSIGLRCWDGMCAISWLLGQDELPLKPGSLGCTGNSGGGTTTLWLTLLDERISAAVVGSYFCSFEKSIRDQWHCECNYIPNVLQWGELGDFAAAIAPRPLRLINGEKDPIFPIGAAREQFQTVFKAYQLLSAPERVDLSVHPDEHRYKHGPSREWFDRWL
ncbi:MAG: alpha/beta hydrolase family protein [Phycisphaerae bacterium]